MGNLPLLVPLGVPGITLEKIGKDSDVWCWLILSKKTTPLLPFVQDAAWSLVLEGLVSRRHCWTQHRCVVVTCCGEGKYVTNHTHPPTKMTWLNVKKSPNWKGNLSLKSTLILELPSLNFPGCTTCFYHFISWPETFCVASTFLLLCFRMFPHVKGEGQQLDLNLPGVKLMLQQVFWCFWSNAKKWSLFFGGDI